MPDHSNHIEIPDALFDEIHTAISEMRVNTFYPEGAREAGRPYVERYRGPMDTYLYNVFATNGIPEAPAVFNAYDAIETYVRLAYKREV